MCQRNRPHIYTAIAAKSNAQWEQPEYKHSKQNKTDKEPIKFYYFSILHHNTT